MEKIACLVKINGKVTGVGFRYSALLFSERFSTVSGYIRNNSYNEVEALIQGDRDEVEVFLQYLHKGPPLARVEAFIVNDVPVSKQYSSFIIK